MPFVSQNYNIFLPPWCRKRSRALRLNQGRKRVDSAEPFLVLFETDKSRGFPDPFNDTTSGYPGGVHQTMNG